MTLHESNALREAVSDLFELCHAYGVFALHLHQPFLIEIETESLHCAGTRIESLTVEDDLRSIFGGKERLNSRSERSPHNREQQESGSHNERDLGHNRYRVLSTVYLSEPQAWLNKDKQVQTVANPSSARNSQGRCRHSIV